MGLQGQFLNLSESLVKVRVKISEKSRRSIFRNIGLNINWFGGLFCFFCFYYIKIDPSTKFWSVKNFKLLDQRYRMDCWEIQSGKQLNYIIIQLLVHLLLLCKKFGLKCLCNLLEINYTHIYISFFSVLA